MSCELWGKWGTGYTGDRYPLRAHLLDTALAAEALWHAWLPTRIKARLAEAVGAGDPDSALQEIRLAAALHDVGKASWVFQGQASAQTVPHSLLDFRENLARFGLGDPCHVPGISRPQLPRGVRRHECLSMLLLQEGQHPRSTDDLSNFSTVSIAVGGHHGNWMTLDAEDAQQLDEYRAGAWGEQQRDLIAFVRDALNAHDLEPSLIRDVPATLLVSGLVVLSDWLASEDTIVTAGLKQITDCGVVAADWLDVRREEIRAHVMSRLGPYVSPGGPDAVLAGNTPRPLQSSAITDIGDAPGLWIVAYPTGEGKTEAALLRHIAGPPDEGLMFALPTRATTDAMFARLTEVFGDVVLSHGLASLTQGRNDAGSGDSWWYSSSLRRLFAPVTAMTCDQVLTGALGIKQTPLRLLALATHHVVLDEVHTYDAYQTELLCELLTWWGATETRVTLLSATLPQWQQKRFEEAYLTGKSSRAGNGPLELTEGASEAAYPSHLLAGRDRYQPGLALHPLPLRIHLGESQSTDGLTTSVEGIHSDYIASILKTAPDARIGVVVNTIDRCVSIAQQVTPEYPGNVLVLHSRMTAAHRRHIEQTLTASLGRNSQTKQTLVVGTQVVEASLDIDLDYMTTDLCPAPSLIQRAGRLGRFVGDPHRKQRIPDSAHWTHRELHVVVPAAEQWGKGTLPYSATELLRVHETLQNLTDGQIRVPEDVQQLVDACAYTPETLLENAGGAESQAFIQRLTEALRVSGRLTPLLMANHGDRVRFRHLCRLTEGNIHPEEAPFRARFIDQVSASFFIINDSTTRSPWALAENDWTALTAKVRNNEKVPKDLAHRVINCSFPASQKFATTLQPASTATLTRAGLNLWEPLNPTLKFIQPVNLTQALHHGCYYDNTYGLTINPAATLNPDSDGSS